MKTTSLRAKASLASIASVVALTLAFVQPAFAQRVIGNIYPDSTDSRESPAVRDPGKPSGFCPYSFSQPHLPPAPKGVYSQTSPKARSLSRRFVAPTYATPSVI